MTSRSALKWFRVLLLGASTVGLASCQFAFGDFHVEHKAQGGSSAWAESSGGSPLEATDAASGGQSAVSLGGSGVSSDSGDTSSSGGNGGVTGTSSGGATASEGFDAEVGGTSADPNSLGVQSGGQPITG